MSFQHFILYDYIAAVCLFLSLATVASANAVTCIEALQKGLDAESHNDLLAKRIDFQKKASEKNPDLRVLDLVELDQLKKERIVIGFVGFSGGKAFNETASRIAIINFLRELDPTRVILSSGATNEGVPALVYEIGHRMGFKTLGVTSLKSGNYEPARMDYIMVEGNNWGRESDYFINTTDLIVGFGGGIQSETEMITARQRGKPLVLVANSEIQGASANIPGQKYAKGEMAGRRVRSIVDNFVFFKWLRKLPENLHYVASEDLREIFYGKRLIGFTGWSANGPRVNRDAQVEGFVRDFLSKLDASKDVVVTGGTHIGAERIVHEVAAQLGFTQIALVSHEIADPNNLLNPYAYAVTPVARSWDGRTFGFVNNIDALVSFGGGQVVSNQFSLATQRGIPVAQMTGNFTNSDRQISDGTVKFRSGRRAVDLILSRLPK